MLVKEYWGGGAGEEKEKKYGPGLIKGSNVVNE